MKYLFCFILLFSNLYGDEKTNKFIPEEEWSGHPVFPKKLRNTTEQSQYVIVEYFMFSYYVEVQIYLIKNISLKKFNCYILDYFEIEPYCKDAEKIVLNICATSLEIAQREFPEYNFTEETYGF